MSEDALYVHLEYGDLKADFKGKPDEVVSSILKFLSRILPSLQLLEGLIYKPSLEAIAEALKGIVELSESTPILREPIGLPAQDMILIGLAAKNLSRSLGLSEIESMDIKELSRFTGKAEKTIRNLIPSLIDSGWIARVERGRYSITVAGLRKVEDIAKKVKSNQS